MTKPSDADLKAAREHAAKLFPSGSFKHFKIGEAECRAMAEQDYLAGLLAERAKTTGDDELDAEKEAALSISAWKVDHLDRGSFIMQGDRQIALVAMKADAEVIARAVNDERRALVYGRAGMVPASEVEKLKKQIADQRMEFQRNEVAIVAESKRRVAEAVKAEQANVRRQIEQVRSHMLQKDDLNLIVYINTLADIMRRLTPKEST